MNIDTVKPYAKAIVAFITPGVTGLVGAVQDSSPGGSNIIGPEWVGIFAACVLTAGAVFGVPNKDPQGVKQDESVQPPDAPAMVVEAGDSVNVPADGARRIYELRGLEPPEVGVGHRQEVTQTYTVNPATPEGDPIVMESAGPDYPIAQDFVGGTTPPTTTQPDKGGYWGGV